MHWIEGLLHDVHVGMALNIVFVVGVSFFLVLDCSVVFHQLSKRLVWCFHLHLLHLCLDLHSNTLWYARQLNKAFPL